MTRFSLLTAVAAAALLTACGGNDEDEPPAAPPAGEELAIPDAPDPVGERQAAASAEFLAENGQRDEVEVLGNGLQIEILQEGSGPTPDPEDTIRFHFVGSTVDGRELQNSRSVSDDPLVVPSPIVPQVESWTDIPIPGFAEAIAQMSEGERALIAVPPEVIQNYYAERGQANELPEGLAFLFDFELIEIINPSETMRLAELNRQQQQLTADAQMEQIAAAIEQQRSARVPDQANDQQVRGAQETLNSRMEEVDAALLRYNERRDAVAATTAGTEAASAAEQALAAAGQEVTAAAQGFAEAQRAWAQELVAANGRASASFIEEAASRSGTTVTESGLVYEAVDDSGDGPSPSASDTVTVNYRGTLPNGETFDSSYDRGEPATFPLDRVIPGWTEGVALMNVGDTYKFYVPAELAYGERGTPGGPIGPNQALVFEVELLDIGANTTANQ